MTNKSNYFSKYNQANALAKTHIYNDLLLNVVSKIIHTAVWGEKKMFLNCSRNFGSEELHLTESGIVLHNFIPFERKNLLLTLVLIKGSLKSSLRRVL